MECNTGRLEGKSIILFRRSFTIIDSIIHHSQCPFSFMYNFCTSFLFLRFSRSFLYTDHSNSNYPHFFKVSFFLVISHRKPVSMLAGSLIGYEDTNSARPNFLEITSENFLKRSCCFNTNYGIG